MRHEPPADDLSLFDKLLINLGLAEAPEAPEYKYLGNPSTQVWIDTHTALYYCPGLNCMENAERQIYQSARSSIGPVRTRVP